MERVFNFIRSLSPAFRDLFGYPTVKFLSDEIEVYFDCTGIIRDLSLLNFACDRFRMFENGGCITVVFTFDISE